MISSASPHKRMIIATALAGLALFAALWLLALSPKRSEKAQIDTTIASQEQRLAKAQVHLATYQSARKQYPGMLAELRRLDEAVPARGAIPLLLRQLQKRARTRKSNLQVAALKPASGASDASSGLTPGATPGGTGGVATLPFTFTYTGEYFDLVHVLAAARRAVTAKSGDLKIDGRLVTIEGLAFQRADPGAPLIRATVSATAYVAAPPAPPKPSAVHAAGATTGGS